MSLIRKHEIIDVDGTSANVKENTNTGSNELLVKLENHICSDNSSSTPLGIDGVFTGDWQYALNYAEIRVSVITDQDSATDGLEMQWSEDGINEIDGVEDNYTILANKGKVFSTPRNWVYFRLKYTNGGTAQTSFNIITMLDKVASKGSSHRISDAIVGDDDAVLMKNVITAEDYDLETYHNIGAHKDVDGEYYLSVGTIQAVHIDPNNSSTTNLTSTNSYTFTGTLTETLGINAIEVFLRTDQNAMIYVDQSSNGTNWDETDSYIYYYSKGGTARTVKAIAKYYRIRIILLYETDTTYFRLQSKLVPISEPLPRSLDDYGRLKTSTGIFDVETMSRAEVEPLGALKTVTPVRLAGTLFNNGTKDPNFWTETVTGSGTVVQSGQITLSTGTTADSSAQYDSVRKARKVSGTTNQFRAVGRLVTVPASDNVRRIGSYNDDNGFFFQVNGDTFGIGSRKATIDTIVEDGSFNGNYGTDVNVDTTLKRFVIEYTSISAKFFIDGVLLHTITSSTDSILNSLDLAIRMENYNENGNTTDNSFQIRFATILRLGELITSGRYYAIDTNGTYVLKYAAGTLQTIINTDNAGSIVVYDGIDATGIVIATVDTAKALGTLTFNAPFSNGLTIVSSGGATITVIYE